MSRALSAALATALLIVPSVAARAADMPGIKTSESNKVAECATPGRLMAYLRSRNDKLDPRFDKIAVEYMRHGEKLGLRWDYTFYQMLLETGHLSFRGDKGRRGDVSPTQNNFAGLGATGGGAAGEKFPDVSSGVLAHLQHVLVYSGEHVDDPVAERTRKVQEWGILKSMQKKARGTVTFAHLATKWAPGSDYVSGLAALASRFQESFCNIADPNPEFVHEARGTSPAVAQKAAPKGKTQALAAAPADTETEEKVSGAELARQAIAESEGQRQGLGAKRLGVPSATPAAPSPSFTLLNPQPAEPTPEAAPPVASAPAEEAVQTKPQPRTKADKSPARGERPKAVAAAAAGAIAKPVAPPKPEADAAAASKCRVWTASYGGQKALIIRVKTSNGFDYTVLDVNEGAERREADAYISAYAKGGEIEAEFQSQGQALEKAFELCPES